MGQLRSAILGGLGLLLSPNAIAEDTGVEPKAKRPTVVLTPQNYDAVIGQYEGPSVVLFYSSQNRTESTQLRNELTLTGVFRPNAKKYFERGDLPPRFGVFDLQQLAYRGWDSDRVFNFVQDTYDLPEGGGPFMVMYKPGVVEELGDRIFDIRDSGPRNTDEAAIGNLFVDAWIRFNLFGEVDTEQQSCDCTVMYQEGPSLDQVPLAKLDSDDRDYILSLRE